MTVHHLKTGRNDLCPCGSGKKHKKCCMTASDDILDFSWYKLRQTEGELVGDILLPYVNSHLPRDILKTALEEFKAGEEVPEDVEELLLPTIFIPWFLFTWIPRMDYVPEKEIGLQYLEKRGYTLTPYQKRVLEAFCQSYYSFYYVLDVVPEKSVHLKDIFLGTEHTIKEKQGTQFLERGHIVFTSLVSLDNQSISISILPYTLSSHHLALIDVKNALKKMMGRKRLTPAMMRDVDNELRGAGL